jgi:hypothetical protein
MAQSNKKELPMSIEKKSLISNRKAMKKANVVKADKPEVAKIASPRSISFNRVALHRVAPNRVASIT